MPENPLRIVLIGVGRDFGAHKIVAQLELRRVLFVEVRALLGNVLQLRDALLGHRMGQNVRVRAHRANGLIREETEHLQHPGWGLVRGIQEFDSGPVRRRFLLPDIGENRAHDHLLAAKHHRGPGLSRIARSP